MIASIFLDVFGIIITYSTDYNIPKYVYSIILILGFIISNYRIYIDNVPEININTSLLNTYPLKSLHHGENHIKLMINYNLYINNYGNNVGIIEDAEVELVGFSKISDEFLLNKVGVRFNEFFIADEEVFQSLEFMKDNKKTKFPILIEPKKTIDKVLILYIEIKGEDEEDYLKTVEWMNDIEFVLKLRTKNNNIEKNKKYNIIVSKHKIEEFRKEEIRKSKDIEDLL